MLLAECHRTGRGAKKDDWSVEYYMKKAAELGSQKAKSYLAQLNSNKTSSTSGSSYSSSSSNYNSTSSSDVYYEGYYTATGKGYNYNQGTYSDTGSPSLNYVKITSSSITVNGKNLAYSGSDGNWIHYGVQDGNHPVYLYNKVTGDLRLRFVFKFAGLNVSDNFWVRGNQMAQNTGTPSPSNYNNGSTYSSSSSTSGTMCQFCSGSGKCKYPSSLDNKYYCQGSGICAICNGSGWMNNTIGTGKIRCTWCRNGKCGYCHGTGQCQHCHGTGRR